MAKKTAKKAETLTLEQVLYNCRTALRGVGATDDNRNAVIGLVFLKFATDKCDKCREHLHRTGQPTEKQSFYRREGVFPVPEKARWDYLSDHSADSDIAKKIDDAMKFMEDENSALAGALPQGLYVGLGAAKDSIKKLINEISRIDETLFHEEDIIGRVYEYFLQTYAAAGSKEDGEFYTPACVVQLIAELIEPYDGNVYDPCCGSGGMFVQSLKFVEKHKGDRKRVNVIGQESKLATWKLCKMNLAIRGIAHDLGNKNASTFTEDLHKDKTGQIDYVMANPPFNLEGWTEDNESIQTDLRWKGYVVPCSSNANYAWILHILSKLKPNKGIAGFLLANGALNDPNELENRKRLVDNDKIEAIIVLPHDMFYTVPISVTLWIINQNKNKRELNGRKLRDRRGEVLFLDLRRWNAYTEKYVIEKGKSKKKTILQPSQIEDIRQIYFNWQDEDRKKYSDVPELCKAVLIEDIAKKGYSLAPSKYVEFIDHDLEIDYDTEMMRIQSEMKKLLKQERASQKMLENAFKGIGHEVK